MKINLLHNTSCANDSHVESTVFCTDDASNLREICAFVAKLQISMKETGASRENTVFVNFLHNLNM